jgi:competence protein ComEC
LLLSLPAGVSLFHLFRFFPWLTLAAAASALALLCFRKKYAPVLLLCLGFVYALARHAPAPGLEAGYGAVGAEGYFASPAVQRRGGFSQGFRVTGGLDGADSLPVLSDREFPVGVPYRLMLKVRDARGRKNPGSGRGGGPCGVLLEARRTGGGEVNSIPLALNRMRQGLNGAIRGRLPPDAASLVMAVTTGQRGEMDYALREDFNSAGLAHLLSISGTHFGLFGVLVFGVFVIVVRHLPGRVLERLTVYLTPREAAALMTLPFTLFYLGISGASVPSIRAFVMMGLFLVGLLVSRKGHWLHFLLAAAILLTLWEPEVVLSLSFQLSFIAVLFIGGAKARELAPPPASFAQGGGGMAGKALGYFKKTFVITLSASIGVLPLVAYHFHYVSVVSPAANLVVAPLVGFLLVPLSLLGSLFHLITGSYALWAVVGPLAEACIGLVRVFASAPFASVNVPHFPAALVAFFYSGALLWAVFRKKYLLSLPLAPALLYAIIAVSSEPPLSVTFLDVGRSDAAVAELPGGKVVVVDTGWSGREAAGYLRYRGIGSIDALVLTHAHEDHAGGAAELIGRFDVREIWDSGRLSYPGRPLADEPARRELGRGDVAVGEGFSMAFLHPYKGFYTLAGGKETAVNNESLVLRLQGGKGSFLFTADIEEEAVEDMLHLGRRLKSDVLKVPHHGLGRSHLEYLARAVSPAVAVVSSDGAVEKTMRELWGARVFVTGRDGAVKVEEGGGGLVVKPYGEYEIRETGDFSEEVRNLRRLFTVW